MTLCPFDCRLSGSEEVFELSSHSDRLRSENITYQDSQKSKPTHSFFKSEAISNMCFVRMYCSLCGLVSSCSCCRATWGRSDPELLLSPLKHTPPASPLSHTVFLSCCRSFHLFTLSLFFWLAIQPAVLLCFMSFPNKQAGRFFFLFLYISEKKLFLFLVHARLGSACV